MLTQGELAEKAGLTNDYISRLESGQRNAGIKTVRKLCAALGCTQFRLRNQPAPEAVNE